MKDNGSCNGYKFMSLGALWCRFASCKKIKPFCEHLAN